MAVCNFCHKEFGNAQGVRAHLKGCDAYKAKLVRQPATASGNGHPVGNAYPTTQTSMTTEFDPVRDIQQRVAAERLRLKLREIERAHAELDDEAASRQAKEAEFKTQGENRASAERRERESLRLKEEAATRANLEIRKQQEQLQTTRRSIIQEAKTQVMDWWGIHPIPLLQCHNRHATSPTSVWLNLFWFKVVTEMGSVHR